jgi:hypothetical protein
MSTQSKFSLLSKRIIRILLGFVVVALVAGVYFLFRPFPAGPTIEAKAGVKEAASVSGWSAYANPPSVVKVDDLQRSQSSASAAVQRFDIGNGYVLENSSQGSKIVAPSAPLAASAAVQRLDIGNGYVLENSSQGSKIVAPSAPIVVAPVAAASATQRLDIGNGYVLENGSQGSKIVSPSVPFVKAPAAAASATQRLDIGNGYVLENSAQGSRIVAPNTQLKLAAATPNADTLSKIDIGSGYSLLLTPGSSWKIVQTP